MRESRLTSVDVANPAINRPGPAVDTVKKQDDLFQNEFGTDSSATKPLIGNVFVAGDLLWYPVEGNNKLRQAPDVMAIFGIPIICVPAVEKKSPQNRGKNQKAASRPILKQ